MSDQININAIHPELEPISSAPSLFSFYGCGLRLLGNRDFSDESHSSVKTLFFTLLFIPIFPISAYRVITQGEQYYFLGKVPVSDFARNYAIGLIMLVIAIISISAWKEYTSSSKYRYGKVLQQAEADFNRGKYAESLSSYKKILENTNYYDKEATKRIQDIVHLGLIMQLSNDTFATILEQLNNFKKSPVKAQQEELYTFAVKKITSNKGDDPAGLHKLLHAARDLKPTEDQFRQQDIVFLKTIVKENPKDVEIAIELSEHYVQTNDKSAAKSVLMPVKDQLGSSEGAKTLGQILVGEGEYKNAYPLLSAYTSLRLKNLQKAEKSLTATQDLFWKVELGRLERGNAPQSFYTEYDKKPQEEQQAFVSEYIGKKINNSPTYQKALEEYREASKIVPVVLDFGILQLRNAETMTSEEERKFELSAAEKTFLSIKNIVGDTDEYRIYLGQVYFWLGKQNEGQQLFDQMLAANSRSPKALLSVAFVLRTLGKVGLSESMAEEAYKNANDNETRYNAANLMSLLSDSTEEKVTWLERADPSSVSVQASLKDSSGNLAEQSGDTAAAIKLYREAIAHSESLPENATNYNNTALIYFSLHRVTADQRAYKKGVELMSKAVEMRPDESILLSNAASFLITNSLYETLGNKINYGYLQTQPSLTTIGYYYNNEQELEALKTKLNMHKDWNQAIEYYQRSILLSPNNVSNYARLFSILYFLKDEKGLEQLSSKITRNQVDFSAANKSTLEYLNGNNADDAINSLQDGISFYNKLIRNKKINSATKAVIHSLIAKNYMRLVELGEISFANKAASEAKLAYTTLPSSSTHSGYIDALLTLASVQTAQRYNAYKSIRNKTVKSVTDPHLLALALNQNDEMATWLKTNGHVKEAVQLISNNQPSYPNQTTSSYWAILNSQALIGAEQIKSNITQSGFRTVVQKIGEQLSPLSGQAVVQKFWLNKLQNKPAIEQPEFEQLLNRGIKLPLEYMR